MGLVAQAIPKLGLVMEAVRVIRWRKSVGDSVTAGEPLLEVETEKAVVEIEAAATGRLVQILVAVDQEANVGDQIAWIDSAEARTANTAAAGDSGANSVGPAHSDAAPARRAAKRFLSTPAARKLATERGVDLGGIAGTGPGGRVQMDDVQRVLVEPRTSVSAAQPLSLMRRALVRAMTLSNATIPQFMVARSVDWTTLLALRREYSAKLTAESQELSLNDFLLQAVARALTEFPALNATFSGDAESPSAGTVQARGAHIGLVVALDNGLLVPVIHDVERLSLAEIASRRRDCVERSLNGRLKYEQAEGATFSISNLGAQGPDRFTAIINPPQSAILAVGRQRDCVVARDGVVLIRPLSELTLTVDHRIADGRLASQFLTRLVSILEAGDWRLE